MPGIELPAVDGGMNKVHPGKGEPPVGAKGKPDAETDADREKKEARASKKREQEILKLALKRYKRAAEAEAENRGKALEDLKFKAGDQWPADVAAKRNSEKRPCLTINGLKVFTHQIANDIRQNRPAINISPLGDEATKESAGLMADFIRSIERDNAADISYDTAIESAIDIGFGYWRVLTEYERPDSFNQVLVVRRVRNSFTVLLDNTRQQPDGSDSGWGFVSEMMVREEFKEKYPGANQVSWKEKTVGEEYKEWVTKDEIRVAEYFTLEHQMRRLVQLENGNVVWWDEVDEAIKAKVASGEMKLLNDRMSEEPSVHWYKITCAEILEEQEWPGKWIPIIEVLGDEIDIEGKVIRSGIIRDAKDPMRMKNYWATSKAEKVALAPKATNIVADGQVEGYEDEWSRAHTDSIPYLTYVPVVGENGQLVPPPIPVPQAGVPQGMVEAEKSAEQDLMRTTGVRFDATLNERMYDESGKALKELRRNTDIGSFHYSDNYSRSLRHMGRILLDLIPKVYDTQRTVPVVAEDGKDSLIRIDPTISKAVMRQPQQDQMQSPMRIFNPKKGNYGCTVTVGPSYATKRIEAQEQMSGFIGKVPEPMRGVVAALIAKYSDWPGSTELYKALVNMLPPGVLMPDQKDLPPAVAAFVASLSKQIQTLMVERMQLLRELTEKRTDQAIARDKINKDFEAKLLKIANDAQKHIDNIGSQAVEQTISAAERIAAAVTSGGQPTGQSQVH